MPASTDGDLAEWASFEPTMSVSGPPGSAHAWLSVTRDRVRFAVRIEAARPPKLVTLHLALPRPPIDNTGDDDSADARYVARTKQIRASLSTRFSKSYSLRNGRVWVANQPLAGATVATRSDGNVHISEMDLPSEALPATAQAPLSRARVALEVSLEDATLAPSGFDPTHPDAAAELAITSPVRFGTFPALVEAVASNFHAAHYAPGPATHEVVVLGRSYDAPEQHRAIVELPVEVGPAAILHRAGSRAFARLTPPKLQGDEITTLLVLEDGAIVEQADVPGRIVAHGAVGDGYHVLALELAPYSFHFDTYYRSNAHVVQLDQDFSMKTSVLFEDYCRGELVGQPTLMRLEVILRCTTGGYDSDAPLVKLPPQRVSVSWDATTGEYRLTRRGSF